MSSPFSLRNISEFIEGVSSFPLASFSSLLFTLESNAGVVGPVLAAVLAAVCAAVVPAIVAAMEALRGVVIEPFRGVTGALRAALYDEFALDAAKDGGLEDL
jgi:hypothetical protein